MQQAVDIYDGLRESYNLGGRNGRWCSISDIVSHVPEQPPFLQTKYKLMDLCKRGLAERKIMNGKPTNLFRPVEIIDSCDKIEISPKYLPPQSSPGTWNFGFDADAKIMSANSRSKPVYFGGAK
jgi:hypothetical protein